MMFQTYAQKKFHSLMFVSMLVGIVEYLLYLSDSIIAGNLLGEDALAGLELVLPLLSLMLSVGILISSGTLVLYSRAAGQQQQDEGNRYFGQGMFLCIVSGLLVTFLMAYYKQEIFSLWDTVPVVSAFASEYYDYMLLFPVFQFTGILLYVLILNDGGERLCTVAIVVKIVFNILLSIVLGMMFGLKGIALATLCSDVLVVALFATHFFRAERSLRFRWHCSLTSFISVCKFGLPDAILFFCGAITEFVLNYFLVRQFGGDAVVIFLLIMSMQTLIFSSFSGIGQALRGLFGVYYGENNTICMQKTMRMAFWNTLMLGGIITLLVFGLADIIPMLFGITDPALLADAALALRIFSFSAVCYSFGILIPSFFVNVGKVALASKLICVLLLVMPICCTMPAGLLFGVNGVWTGLLLASVASMGIYVLLLRKNNETNIFSFFTISPDSKDQLSYDTALKEKKLVAMLDRIEEDLKARGLNLKLIYKIRLVIEEYGILTLHRNTGKQVMLECNLFFSTETVTLIIRDDGIHGDCTDDNAQIFSMHDYLEQRIVSGYTNKKFIKAIGDNRSVLSWPLAQTEAKQ